MSTQLRLVSCGDRAVLVCLGDRMDPGLNRRVHALSRGLLQNRHPAVVDVTPSYHSLLIEYDPVRLRLEQVEEMVRSADGRIAESPATERTVEIPVLYGGAMGPDLKAVAAHTGLSPDELVRRHAGGTYRVYCLGFSPGFPYLGGLDPALRSPRLPEPRTVVPGGSVGIGGEQTGVYPSPSPGGWQLLGRTPVRLFDPRRSPPALLAPGDTVRFVPIDPARFAELEGYGQLIAPALPEYTPGKAGLRILQPGLMTTTQDTGRRGFSHLGVPTAGAADIGSIMIGNWLLGNRARSGALEITLGGLEVEFTGLVTFALTGARMPAELLTAGGGTQAVPGWRTIMAGPGDRLRIGQALEGFRSYLCVAGGIDLEPVLGSLSEDLFGKIGPLGRPLAAGDWLPVGLPLQPPADVAGRDVPADAVPRYHGRTTVRATRGPQAGAFTQNGIAAFFRSDYTIGASSDRQGLRLNGPHIEHAGPADILSEPLATGSIQVPANGQPILLLANRQTMGGYTKVAVAVFPDVGTAGQMRPGDTLNFKEVDQAEATAIAWAERRRLAQIRRHLERELGAPPEFSLETVPAPAIPVAPEVAAPAPAAITYSRPAPPAVSPDAAPTAAGSASAEAPATVPPQRHPRVRTFKITLSDVIYDAVVEEADDE